jgi:DNA-binding transcriptional regulator GbsR (MarR family)
MRAVNVRDEDDFIEQAAPVFGAGMPRMAGRMWAYLAICDPPEQTASDIAARLQASRGSVSGMARLLEHVGLIRRGTRAGDRREYFWIPPEAMHRQMDGALTQLRLRREVADAGLALIADRSPESQARLRDIRDLYAFFEAEWPSILARMHQADAAARTTTQNAATGKEAATA